MGRLLFLFFFLMVGESAVFGQQDSLALRDSLRIDSVKKAAAVQLPAINRLLDSNRLLNTAGTPASLTFKKRHAETNNSIFYIVAGLLLFLGILKTSFAKYFNTLFRVFFNTSLRQGQLTDQLQQNKLASLFFNIFSVITASMYVALLIHYFGLRKEDSLWKLMASAAGLFIVVYFTKFLVLGFTGWVTNYKEEAGVYVFNVFLINKVMGICLVPVIVLMAFAEKQIAEIVVISSFVIIGLLILMRFIRSYSLLQHRLKFNVFHFLLYVFSLEVLPIMLIYRAVVVFLTGNQ